MTRFTLTGMCIAALVACKPESTPLEGAELGTGVTALEKLPASCAIQTVGGYYVTAVDGGGHVADALRTDATRIAEHAWFTFVDAGDGGPIAHYGVRTSRGNFLTIIDGGGRSSDVIHSDATELFGWEKITLIGLADDRFAIQTMNGHFLTATAGGGRIAGAIMSDATRIGEEEKYKLICRPLAELQ